MSWPILIVGVINLALGWASGIFWEKGNQTKRETSRYRDEGTQ